MGLLNLLGGLFHGHKVDVEYLAKRSNMANDTLIFTGQPDYTSVIATDMNGNGDPISPQIIQQMAADDAKLNAAHPIAGQRMPRGRGVGVNTQQMPPQSPMQYPQQPQYGQMAPSYAPPAVPAQQQYVPVQQPPQGINIPIGNAQPQPAAPQGGFLPEPFSELVMTDTECHLFVDLPGIPKENISIKLTQNNEVAVTFRRDTHVSVMSAAKQPAKKGEKGSKRKKEATKWAAQVNIPDYLLGEHTVVYNIMKPVDENNIKCSFDLGQLHVTLGFRTPMEGKSISIG